MNERDLDARLRAKYRSRSTTAAPPTLARRVLAIPATSPQRRGWLPRLSFGGTQPMFSVTKMAASVVVIALSGAVIGGVIADRPSEGPISGAEAPTRDMTSHPVSGTIAGVPSTPAAKDVEFTSSSDQGGVTWRDVRDEVVWDASDVRLTGDARYVENGAQHRSTWTGVRSTAWVLENEAGTWTGTGPAFDTFEGGSGFVMLTGAGDYEGLMAYIALGPELDPDVEDGSEVRGFEGVIFQGDIPAQPEIPTP